METVPKWIGALGVSIGKSVLEISNEKKVILIDSEQLKLCAPSISVARAQVMTDLINKLFPAYGIVTIDILHEPLANFLQESLEFSYKAEDMNYRAQTLANTWPGKCSTTKKKPYVPNALALSLARKPRETANAMYGSRMGNRPGTDDGWNLRGSGFVGLTGRYVLEAYAKYKGFKTAEEAAAYARDSDYGALDSALWFFCILKDLMDEADRDDFIGIVKEINGGTIGLKSRLYYYNLVKKHIV